jgi:hypothetical protein
MGSTAAEEAAWDRFYDGPEFGRCRGQQARCWLVQLDRRFPEFHRIPLGAIEALRQERKQRRALPAPSPKNLGKFLGIEQKTLPRLCPGKFLGQPLNHAQEL